MFFVGDYYLKFVWEKYCELFFIVWCMFDYFVFYKEFFFLKLEMFRLMCGFDLVRFKKWCE